MTYPQRVESLSQAQRERLAYIDFKLYFFGEIGRPDLTSRFGVAPAGATRDLALYREIAPQNIEFDGSSKVYRIGKDFIPILEHAPQRVLSSLTLGFGDGVNGASQPLLPCESPTALSNPKMDVLAPICRAIHAKRPIAIRYHSMSSGESERVIVPFALVDTGLRWHVRAFDRKSGEFRDFVVTRIEAPTLLDEESQANERSDNDIQWTRIVELDFVPQPPALPGERHPAAEQRQSAIAGRPQCPVEIPRERLLSGRHLHTRSRSGLPHLLGAEQSRARSGTHRHHQGGSARFDSAHRRRGQGAKA